MFEKTIIVELCETTPEFVEWIGQLGFPSAITLEYDMSCLKDICESMAVDLENLLYYISRVAGESDENAPVVNLCMSTVAISALDTCISALYVEIELNYAPQEIRDSSKKIAREHRVPVEAVCEWINRHPVWVDHDSIEEYIQSIDDAITEHWW